MSNNIIKNLGIFINNSAEFNSILGNDCIMSGDFVLFSLNKSDENINKSKYNSMLSIYLSSEKKEEIVLFMLLNNFSNYKGKYIKVVNTNVLVTTLHITTDPVNKLNEQNILNIQKVYFDGKDVIYLHPRDSLLKTEKIKENIPINTKQLTFYKSLGYSFEYKNILRKESSLYNNIQYLRYKYSKEKLKD